MPTDGVKGNQTPGIESKRIDSAVHDRGGITVRSPIVDRVLWKCLSPQLSPTGGIHGYVHNEEETGGVGR